MTHDDTYIHLCNDKTGLYMLYTLDGEEINLGDTIKDFMKEYNIGIVYYDYSINYKKNSIVLSTEHGYIIIHE